MSDLPTLSPGDRDPANVNRVLRQAVQRVMEVHDIADGALQAASNLSDLADPAAARGNLGLETSSTDNAVVRFDGTTGETQNSGVTIDDSNVMAGVSRLDLTGGQIAFPATQNASSNANTLDDYEEGTWTATDGSGASLTIAGSGSYVKIGQLVLASFNLTYPATANGNTAVIAGFPFAFESLADGVYGGAIGYSDLNATGVWLYTNTNAASARISDAQNLNLKTNAQVSGKSFRGFCAYRTTA